MLAVYGKKTVNLKMVKCSGRTLAGLPCERDVKNGCCCFQHLDQCDGTAGYIDEATSFFILTDVQLKHPGIVALEMEAHLCKGFTKAGKQCRRPMVNGVCCSDHDHQPQCQQASVCPQTGWCSDKTNKAVLDFSGLSTGRKISDCGAPSLNCAPVCPSGMCVKPTAATEQPSAYTDESPPAYTEHGHMAPPAVPARMPLIPKERIPLSKKEQEDEELGVWYENVNSLPAMLRAAEKAEQEEMDNTLGKLREQRKRQQEQEASTSLFGPDPVAYNRDSFGMGNRMDSFNRNVVNAFGIEDDDFPPFNYDGSYHGQSMAASPCAPRLPVPCAPRPVPCAPRPATSPCAAQASACGSRAPIIYVRRSSRPKKSARKSARKSKSRKSKRCKSKSKRRTPCKSTCLF